MAVIGLSRLRYLACNIGSYEERLKDVYFFPVLSTSHSHVSIVGFFSPFPQYILSVFVCVVLLSCSATSIRFVIIICVVLVIVVVVIIVESR